MKERRKAGDTRRAYVVQRGAVCQRGRLGNERHRGQRRVQNKQGRPETAPYPREEGVEQTRREPLAYEGVAGTLLLLFLKCWGD